VRKLSYFCPAKHKSIFIAQYDKMTKRLRRNSQDQVIAGVASGIADYFGMESWVTRILFIILFFSGGGILVYIIMWIALPESDYQNQNPMEEQKQKPARSENGNIIAGVLLITVGGLILISRYFPEIDFRDIWPWSLIVVGILILFKGLSKNK
jgi:phage shock protein C